MTLLLSIRVFSWLAGPCPARAEIAARAKAGKAAIRPCAAARQKAPHAEQLECFVIIHSFTKEKIINSTAQLQLNGKYKIDMSRHKSRINNTIYCRQIRATPGITQFPVSNHQ